MNFKNIIYILGFIILFIGAFLMLPCITGLLYSETKESLVYLGFGILYMIIGALILRYRPKTRTLFSREGAVAVALGWIVMSLLGAIPFKVLGEIPSYLDAVFETVSGFTTTGSSILTSVETLSHASLFWRSFTHWVGGMGVLVLIMAVLPMMGGYDMNLMKMESPGPSVTKFVPHIKDSTKILYSLYFIITMAQIICLLISGMPLFDTLCITFGTVGTGGFGVHSDSCASYTIAQQYIISIFMILSGVNYTAYFLIASRKWKAALHLEEVRWYLIIIGVSTVLICLNIRSMFPTLEESFRASLFGVSTIITTTGYATVDFDLWPSFSKFILCLLMIVGACAGSTGGGLKVSRVLILTRGLKNELSLIVHPHERRIVRLDGEKVESSTVRNTQVYLSAYSLILAFSILIVSLDGFDFETNVTAVLATFNNIGPGLAGVGPTSNFSAYSALSKIVLIFDMLAGRLEIFPLLILFYRKTWKKH
ncbi:MAG: TrkH family potassium uptake protein [Lachnospiraceae bacterium]|jgi:trk system potassium uptake protein TrkH